MKSPMNSNKSMAKTSDQTSAKKSVPPSTKKAANTPKKTLDQSSAKKLVQSSAKKSVPPSTKKAVNTPKKTSNQSSAKKSNKSSAKKSNKSSAKKSNQSPAKKSVNTPAKTLDQISAKKSVQSSKKTPLKIAVLTPAKTTAETPIKTTAETRAKTTAETPVKTSDQSPKNESPYVSYEKLKESIEVIKKLSELGKEVKTDKIKLIEDEVNSMVKLQINFKKIPNNKTTYINLISLPNHWRHEKEYEICLIVKDLDKTPLTDRELDLDQTKSHYKELLSKDNSDQLVTEILPMRELRNEYKLFEAKERLSKAFDVFICDRKLLHNKFDYLSRFLGKTFWISEKKVPIPVDLTSSTLKADLQLKLSQTPLYLSGKGDTSNVNIGLLKQSTDKLADNLLAVTKKLCELYGNNIGSLSLKTDKSIAIIFFMDCGFISDITLDTTIRDNTPIEDDFSHFYKSNVQIFKDGDVRVVPKPANELDNTEDIDEVETEWLSMNSKRRNGKRSYTFRSNTNKKFKRRKTNKKTDKKTDNKTK